MLKRRPKEFERHLTNPILKGADNSMAFLITEDCISCGACEPVCPNQAITQDGIYVINADRCTECQGFHDEPQCIPVCPVECIVPNPNRQETKEELLAKKEQLHTGETVH
jgi:ferredoxin